MGPSPRDDRPAAVANLPPDQKAVHKERAKITANFLNAAANTCLGAGVIAPLAAAVFGVAGPNGPVSPLTLTIGMLIFLVVALGLHAAARPALQRLR